MSGNNFFSNFPLINYALPGTLQSGTSNGSLVVDITKSVKLDPSLLSNVYFFSSTDIEGGERADQLSQNLYSTPFLDWTIWMSNQQIDPNDWYMDTETFDNYVNQKYGDIVLAQQRVLYYINNWYSGSNLTVSGFEALDPTLTKFYQPQVAQDGITILHYSRTPVDWLINTNHMLQFIFQTANTVFSNTFIDNEICTVTWDSLGNTVNGQFVSLVPANSTTQIFTIQHLIGNYDWWQTGTTNALAFQIQGSESNSLITISSNSGLANVSQYDAIGPLEDVYYDPVTQFDYENIRNENNKYIQTLNPGYVPLVVKELENAFT